MTLSQTDTPTPISKEENLDFRKNETRGLTHCFHDYPARMIPPLAARLIQAYAPPTGLLFDPYCGSGTSLVEGLLAGLAVVGTDLNPLARLISFAKTHPSQKENLVFTLENYQRWVSTYSPQSSFTYPTIEGIKNPEYWFRADILEKLLFIKDFIINIPDLRCRAFFQVAFSETVRESSNTRNSEFKIYRYNEQQLTKFNPLVFDIMNKKILRNQKGLAAFWQTLTAEKIQLASAEIYDFNTVEGLPAELAPESVDIVVTSPPYGDSHTTVAYGQYSRFSAALLDLPDSGQIDRKLMGGQIYKTLTDLPSLTLQKALDKITTLDAKRSREVKSFYVDYYRSIQTVAALVKPKGMVCYVVGNRKVKGVLLPTDIITKDFFEQCGFTYQQTLIRDIPNKRMPAKNSPSNEVGVLEDTMTKEYIVILQKK